MYKNNNNNSHNNRWQILSGSWLKILAIISMVVDHIAQHVLYYLPEYTQPLFTMGNKNISICLLMVYFGRIAFPLFAFLIVEGFIHTHDYKKYCSNLLIFALLSIIPWNLARYGHCIDFRTQNVMFTLLLGVLSLNVIKRWETNHLTTLQLATIITTILLAADLLHTDYHAKGVAFILALYTLRHTPVLQTAIGAFLLPMSWKAILAFIPINLYNGQRGFISGTAAKYTFYLFYPLHLLIIYFFRLWVLS